MPQFDVFLFFSSLFYLLLGFFGLMFYNQFFFLPKVSAIIKLREKIQLVSVSEFSKKTLELFKLSKNLY